LFYSLGRHREKNGRRQPTSKHFLHVRIVF
jgi:hypothetical protein